MIDKTTIIVTYNSNLDKTELLRFGRVLNDLPRVSMLFLRVEDDVMLHVAALTGVVRADYNEIHRPDDFLHSQSPFSAQENWKIFQEMGLPAAHAITTGDPRVRIASLDSGFSSERYDIGCISGGRFYSGMYHADNNLPMKIKIADLPATGMGILMGASLYVHDPNVADHHSLVPASGYAESTCKTPLFTGAIPMQLLFDPNLAFWVKEAVDLRLDDEDLSYWHTGLGRSTMYDIFGHGDAVAGIINDIAPDCTTVVFKLTDDQGNLHDIDVVACMDYVASQNFHIISTSWGGPINATKEAAYNRLLSTGVLWVCSAGNAGVKPDTDVAVDPYLYPGALPGVFCVGACGQQTAENTDTGYIDYHPDYIDYSRLTYFSQKHDRVQIVAPGFGYQVHAPLNPSYNNIGKNVEFARNWNMVRHSSQRSGGTSWAQPAMAGSAGLVMSRIISRYQTTDPAEVTTILRASVNTVKNALTSTAKVPVKLSNGNPATVGFGVGRLDVGAAVGAV